jgi:L-seryl-tRNA(Ser) seleniumtransferase
MDNAQLREVPSVDEVLLRLKALEGRFPRRVIVDEVRRVLGELRDKIRIGKAADPAGVEARVEEALTRLESPSLRRVINATGVVLHTNLGRAPLTRFEPLFGYSNLEYDIDAGRRGKRDVHVAGLLERLTGARGIAVNNNAAAVFRAERAGCGARSDCIEGRVDRDRRWISYPRYHEPLGGGPAGSRHY